MNAQVFDERWPELRTAARVQWLRLSDAELDEIDGSRDLFSLKLQQHYGYGAEGAEKALEEWLRDIATRSTRAERAS